MFFPVERWRPKKKEKIFENIFEKKFWKKFWKRFWKKNVEFFLEKNLKKKLEKKLKKTNFEETKILNKKLKKSPKSGNNFIVSLHWISMRTDHLPDWSSPDDPARVLAAVGRLNPNHLKE